MVDLEHELRLAMEQLEQAHHDWESALARRDLANQEQFLAQGVAHAALNQLEASERKVANIQRKLEMKKWMNDNNMIGGSTPPQVEETNE